MKCSECRDNIVDYLYHELSPEKVGEMEEHLDVCKECATQVYQFQFVITSFQQLKKQEPDALTHQRIIAYARETSSQARTPWYYSLLYKQPALTTVMVVLLAVGIFYSVREFIPIQLLSPKGAVKVERGGIPEDKVDLSSPGEWADFPRQGRGKEGSTFLSPIARRAGEDVGEKQLTSLTQEMDAPLPGSMVQVTNVETPSGEKEALLPSRDVLYAFELGNQYFSHNEFEKAVAFYSLALMAHPQGAYADTIRYQLALSYKRMNDCQSAIKVLDDIRKRYPNYPEIDQVILMAGDCYMDLKAYDKAESHYCEFARMFPERESLVSEKLEIARKFRRVNLSY